MGYSYELVSRQRSAIVWMFAIATVLFAGCSSTATKSPANVAAATEPSSSQPPESAVATTTVVSTTAVPTTTEPVNEVDAARSSWNAFASTLADTATVSDIGQTGSGFVAATADATSGVVTVWSWLGGQWQQTDSPPVSLPGLAMQQLAFVDLTGDSNDELFVAFNNMRHDEGLVFQRSSGAWVQIADGLGVTIDNDRLIGVENMCMPSCADGFSIPVEYVWNGSEFIERTVDSSGRLADLFETRKCDALQTNLYEPLKLCDEGQSVVALQAALNSDGYLFSTSANGPEIDGLFGPDTASSIRLYQYRIGVPMTGVAEGQWYHDLIESYNALGSGEYLGDGGGSGSGPATAPPANSVVRQECDVHSTGLVSDQRGTFWTITIYDVWSDGTRRTSRLSSEWAYAKPSC